MADLSGTIPPLTPIHNSLGETMGSIMHMVANPQSIAEGMVTPRYVGGVSDPAIEEAPGRPATLRGIDVTTIDDPYEHERSGGQRQLSPIMHRGL